MPPSSSAEHPGTTHPSAPPEAQGGRWTDHAASAPEGDPPWCSRSVRLARRRLLAAGRRGEPIGIEFAARSLRAAEAAALLRQILAATRTSVVLLLRRLPARGRPTPCGGRRG